MCEAGYVVAVEEVVDVMEGSRRREAPTRKREYGPLDSVSILYQYM